MTIDEVIRHCDRRVKGCEMVYDTDSKVYQEHKLVAKCLRKLKHYEDLEKQGKLIELPCAYDDTVYVIDCDKERILSREEAKLVNALKYWCDTNTECGVTHIPSSLLLKAIEAFQKAGE